MTRRLGLGAHVRLIREAGTVRSTPSWVFLSIRLHEPTGNTGLSPTLLFGSTSLFSTTGSPLRRNHRKPGSRTLPLTIALFTLPDVQLHWGQGQVSIHGKHGLLISKPPP